MHRAPPARGETDISFLLQGVPGQPGTKGGPGDKVRGQSWLHLSKGAWGQGPGTRLKDCKAQSSVQAQRLGLDTSPLGLTTSLLSPPSHPHPG